MIGANCDPRGSTGSKTSEVDIHATHIEHDIWSNTPTRRTFVHQQFEEHHRARLHQSNSNWCDSDRLRQSKEFTQFQEIIGMFPERHLMQYLLIQQNSMS